MTTLKTTHVAHELITSQVTNLGSYQRCQIEMVSCRETPTGGHYMDTGAVVFCYTRRTPTVGMCHLLSLMCERVDKLSRRWTCVMLQWRHEGLVVYRTTATVSHWDTHVISQSRCRLVAMDLSLATPALVSSLRSLRSVTCVTFTLKHCDTVTGSPSHLLSRYWLNCNKCSTHKHCDNVTASPSSLFLFISSQLTLFLTQAVES